MIFPKHETKKMLDRIREMSDEEIAIYADFIRKTAESARITEAVYRQK